MSDNEYFKKTELSLFLKTRFFGHQGMMFLFLCDFIYFVLLIVSQCLKDYLCCITTSIVIIFYSAFIFVAFVVFKKKTKIHRYLKFIDSNYLSFVSKNSYTIKAFRELRDFYVKDKEDASKAFAYSALNCYSDYIRGFEATMKTLKEKANEGVDITNEQNIVEEYLCEFIKRTKNPYQLVLLVGIIDDYFKVISSFKELSTTKNPLSSIKTILLSLVNLINSNSFEILQWEIKLGEDNYHYFYKFNHSLTLMKELSFIQLMLPSFFELLVEEVDSVGKNLGANFNKYYNNEIKSLKKKIEHKKELAKKNADLFTQYLEKKLRCIEELVRTDDCKIMEAK